MNISLSTLSGLEAGKSYYLDDTTGTIKRTGLVQWFKCVTGWGDGRAKAQRLAQVVKASLLAAAGISSDATLNNDISQFDAADYSLSGATLRDIAGRFKAAHADAIAAVDARRKAYGIAEKVVDAKIKEWVKGRRVVNDPDKPESLGYIRKIALYSVQHLVEKAADERTVPENLEYTMGSCMFRAIDTINTVELMQIQGMITKLNFPMGNKNGNVTLPIHRFELDELHFRAILAALITKDGLARTSDFINRLSLFEEEILQERKEAFSVARLAPPDVPCSGYIFAEAAFSAFKAMEDSEWHRQA